MSHHALVGSVEAPEVLLAAGCMWEETFGSALECWGKELDASGEQHKDRRGSPGPVLGVVGGAGVVDVGVGSPRPPEVRAGLGFGRGGGGRTTPCFLKFGVVPLLRRVCICQR